MTGGTGFIGTWLLQVLQRANDRLGSRMELVVLTRDPERARQQAPHVFNRPDTTLVAGDVSHFAARVGKLDLCLHAATDVGDPHKVGDPLKVFDSIVQGTRRVLDLAHANGASRFYSPQAAPSMDPSQPIWSASPKLIAARLTHCSRAPRMAMVNGPPSGWPAPMRPRLRKPDSSRALLAYLH